MLLGCSVRLKSRTGRQTIPPTEQAVVLVLTASRGGAFCSTKSCFWQLEKEEMKNPRVSRRKEILKIRAEINAKETKETIAKINKAKSWFFGPVIFNETPERLEFDHTFKNVFFFQTKETIVKG